MQIREWRTSKGLVLAECAAALGLDGGARSFQRIETGETKPDADLIDKILRLTEGEVTVADMHETRLSWLRENRPDKFDAPEEAA